MTTDHQPTRPTVEEPEHDPLPPADDPEAGVRADPGNSDMDHLIEPVADDDDIHDRLLLESTDPDTDDPDTDDPDTDTDDPDTDTDDEGP